MWNVSVFFFPFISFPLEQHINCCYDTLTTSRASESDLKCTNCLLNSAVFSYSKAMLDANASERIMGGKTKEDLLCSQKQICHLNGLEYQFRNWYNGKRFLLDQSDYFCAISWSINVALFPSSWVGFYLLFRLNCSDKSLEFIKASIKRSGDAFMNSLSSD